MFGKKNDSEEQRFCVMKMNTESTFHCYVITDEETGVQYLYAWGGAGGGLTPLLDENGQVIVKK